MGRYKISDLENLSGVKAHTIRIWEQRYKLLTPLRSETNIRYYDDTQLRKLLNVVSLMNSGNKISAISKLTEEQLHDKIGVLSNVGGSGIKEEMLINQMIGAGLSFDEVQFENAWGVCDEDIYNKVLKEADINHNQNQPFFNFIMTTSNHRPFTYPEGRIDIPSKTGRGGAVKYTDYAINDFIKKAQQKPWFSNTVFVIMSDHCASSAGRQELDASKYHIPAMIYNLPNDSAIEIDKMCSQIDLFPTLFGYLNWSYYSQLFGRDINLMKANDERAFVGNYRKMGYLKGNNLAVLGDQKVVNYYEWDRTLNELTITDQNSEMINQAISFYQCQDHLYQNGLLKTKK